MRYHCEKPDICATKYGKLYYCEHPVYNSCTLFLIKGRGLAVIQQRYEISTRMTWWGEIDDWLANALYLHPGFRDYFEERAGKPINGIYPTVAVRQIMWALKMKPMKRERWETVFDRRDI